jgi:hypothetical protein
VLQENGAIQQIGDLLSLSQRCQGRTNFIFQATVAKWTRELGEHGPAWLEVRTFGGQRGTEMYMAAVLLLTLFLPAAAIGVDLWLHPGADLIWLIGKWFTFFAVGIRLSIAGIRQNVQPEFTARDIFKVQDRAAHAIVREVGFGNLAIGAAGLLTLALPNWLQATAFIGGVYYGLAGIGHAIKTDRNMNENVALVSDVLLFMILLAFVAVSIFSTRA